MTAYSWDPARAPIMIASGVHLPVHVLPAYLGPKIRHLQAVSCKGTTYLPREGNRPPRFAVRESNLANSIGLQNPGIEEQLRLLAQAASSSPDVRWWLNVHAPDISTSLPHIPHGTEIIRAIEVNISCPNVESHDLNLQDLVKLRNHFSGSIFLKCPPGSFFETPQLEKKIRELEPYVDGFVISNTWPTPVREFTKEKFEKDNFGVTGPFLIEKNLATISKLRSLTRLDIVGCGGARTVKDVQRYLDAGTVCVAIGSALLYDPHCAIRIATTWLEAAG